MRPTVEAERKRRMARNLHKHRREPHNSDESESEPQNGGGNPRRTKEDEEDGGREFDEIGDATTKVVKREWASVYAAKSVSPTASQSG